MGSSGLARIYFSDSHGVAVECTDSEAIESVLDELKKLVPSCRVRKAETISGETYHWGISKLRDQDWAVAFWIIKQLCLQGWEPFSTSDNSYGDLKWLNLRRSIAA